MSRVITIQNVPLCIACGHLAHDATKCGGYDRWNDKCWCDTPMYRFGVGRPVKKKRQGCSCGHNKKAHVPECFHRSTHGKYDCECTRFQAAI